MKKIWSLVCSVLLLLSLGIPVFAEETELKASVPGQHTVTVNSDGGRIVADGIVLGDRVVLGRHSEQEYRVIPAPGKRLQSLTYNGEDVTETVKYGVFVAPRLVRDAALTAVYTDAPPAPDEKEYDIGGTVVDGDGNPLPGVTVDIGGKTGATDGDGCFEIGDVPSGTHPVVITDKDGKVIGSGELTIDKAERDDLTLTTDENGNPAVKPGKDTKNIFISLIRGADGGVRVKDAKDTTKPSQPTAPPTGDRSNLWRWMTLLPVSGGGVIFGMVYGKKKKKANS